MATADQTATDRTATALHWRDFVCPFCYVGQQRTAVLRAEGWTVEELPFAIHPEIPEGGVPAGARTAPFYRWLEQEAVEAGLPLNWPPRLPNTRFALTLAEQVRRTQVDVFPALDHALFAAHFAEERDIGRYETVWEIAEQVGADLAALRTAVFAPKAELDLEAARVAGEQAGVTGTPAWSVAGELIVGLQPVDAFRIHPPAPDEVDRSA